MCKLTAMKYQNIFYRPLAKQNRTIWSSKMFLGDKEGLDGKVNEFWRVMR